MRSRTWGGLLALGLSALAARDARAQAPPLEVTSTEGCPSAAWVRGELAQRGLRPSGRIVLESQPEGFAASIDVTGADGASITRRLIGPRCQTVAEGMLLVLEVNLAPPPPASPAPATTPPDPAAPEPPGRPPPATEGRRAFGAIGLGIGATTALTRDFAPVGGIGGWISDRSTHVRGVAATITYGRDSVGGATETRLDHVAARVDVLPFSVALGGATSLGPAAFVSAGLLRARADLEDATSEARMLWLVGVGPRVRHRLEPLVFELALDGTYALTRRRFVIDGLAEPVHTLPRLGLAVGAFFGFLL